MNNTWLGLLGGTLLVFLGLGTISHLNTSVGNPAELRMAPANPTGVSQTHPNTEAPEPISEHFLNSDLQPSSEHPATTYTGPIRIGDADLNDLASRVHLSQANGTAVDKKLWTQAIPVAQQLMEGPCDCEQRNWLRQFIAMGNYALSDSPKYHEWAKLMDKLPLNDQYPASRYHAK